jgi:Xaa-Pro aminopeptidase
MRHLPIDNSLFSENRKRLSKLLPAGTLAIVNANDIQPTCADGVLMMHPNSDIYYLSGIEQEQSILLLFPNALEPRNREILFMRQPNDHLAVWEGHKHTKEQAREISGIENVQWLSEFPTLFRILMCEAKGACLNTNEHARADVTVQTRDMRFIQEAKQQFPLHQYHRLAPILHHLRAIKSNAEIELLKIAVDITRKGFLRLLNFVKPGVTEHECEAELAHEYIKNRGKFAYLPIIASGKDNCILHYIENKKTLQDGELLLLDTASSYGNYNADLTRTIPVNGKFTQRQKDVYNAVLRVLRSSIKGATPGKMYSIWQKEAQGMMNQELLELGLISKEDINNQDPHEPACRKYFMHGLGHPLGLDVHDVARPEAPMQEGYVMTVEPGIYIPEEGFGVRLEDDIVITANGPLNLMADIPIEAEEIEDLMHQSSPLFSH